MIYGDGPTLVTARIGEDRCIFGLSWPFIRMKPSNSLLQQSYHSIRIFLPILIVVNWEHLSFIAFS